MLANQVFLTYHCFPGVSLKEANMHKEKLMLKKE